MWRWANTMPVACVLAVLSLCAPLSGGSATRPATRPAALVWGKAIAGLQTAIRIDGDLVVGGKFALRVSLRNVGAVAGKMPAGEKLFGWLFLVQKTADGKSKKAYFTDKLLLARKATDFPAALAGGRTVHFQPVDLSAREVYAYRRGLRIITGYPTAPAGSPRPAVAGKVAQTLRIGELTARLMLYLPRGDEGDLMLASNTLRAAVGPPDLKTLSRKERAAFVADLIKQFDRDAWSGQAAHGTAVRLGKDLVPALIEAARQPKRPAHSRMWLTTALADLRDPRAAEALIGLLGDRLGGVRLVVAYHGPKQRSKKLDAAITARCGELKDSSMTAMALLGFLVFRKDVPVELLKLGLDSPDPRARAAVAEAMSRRASDFNVTRLTALLKDKDQRVRGLAARALGGMKAKNPKVLAALIAAMGLEGDLARMRICEALGALTGQSIPYDPKATPKVKRQTLERWRKWWKTAKRG